MLQNIFQKLLAFFMSVLAFLGFVKPSDVRPDSYAVKNDTVEFCFDSNPSTGYTWTAEIDGDAVALTLERFEPAKQTGNVAVAGAGGLQYYTLTAVREGEATVTFTYARSWETTDADRVVTARLLVAADKTLTVTDYREK